MSNIRAITLGSGYDTLKGEPMGTGAIKTMTSHDDKNHIKDDSTLTSGPGFLLSQSAQVLFERSDTPPAIETERTEYEITLISDYVELSKALNLQFGLTGALIKSPSVSLEAGFLKKIELSKQTLSLLITSKTVTKVKHIAPDAKLTPAARQILKESPHSFFNTYGDGYVTEKQYGKVLLAMIKYSNTNKTELNEIKSILKGSLTNLGTSNSSSPKFKPGTEIKINIEDQLKKTTKNTIIDIKLDYAGVKTPEPPAVGCDIDKLLKFIAAYNNPANLKPDTIIGFATKSYTTVCTPFYDDFNNHRPIISHVTHDISHPTPSHTTKHEYLPEQTIASIQAAQLLTDRINRARSLLVKCDICYQRLRLIIPTIENLAAGLKKISFTHEADKEKVIIIDQLLSNAQHLEESISLLIQKIYEHKLEPYMLNKIIKNDSIREQSHEISNALEEHSISDKLIQLINLISREINYIESTIDTFSQNLSAEIANISPTTAYFHLARLPSTGATVLWKINFPGSDKNNESPHIKFNILIKKINNSHCLSTAWTALRSWHTDYYDISHGVETRLKIFPQDRVKIQFTDRRYRRRRDFKITAHIIGPQAFELSNSRYATTWVTEALNRIQSRSIPTELSPTAFYFINGDDKHSAPTVRNERSLESLSHVTQPAHAAECTTSSTHATITTSLQSLDFKSHGTTPTGSDRFVSLFGSRDDHDDFQRAIFPSVKDTKLSTPRPTPLSLSTTETTSDITALDFTSSASFASSSSATSLSSSIMHSSSSLTVPIQMQRNNSPRFFTSQPIISQPTSARGPAKPVTYHPLNTEQC
jgi:hypothetical protein